MGEGVRLYTGFNKDAAPIGEFETSGAHFNVIRLNFEGVRDFPLLRKILPQKKKMQKMVCLKHIRFDQHFLMHEFCFLHIKTYS